MVLTLNEHDRLHIRRRQREYFSLTGDHSALLLPPCIILGEGVDNKKRILPPRILHMEKAIGYSRYGSFIRLCEQEALEEIEAELGLERCETGLYLSMRRGLAYFDLGLESIRIKALECLELEENTRRTFTRRSIRY